MAVKVLQKKEISEGGKNEERKGVGSAIRRRKANRKSINIKERERGGPHSQSWGQAKGDRR